MAKGTIYKSETICFTDPQTGVKIQQLTNEESIHHHPFFMIPAYDQSGSRLTIVSHRTGTPQIFSVLRPSGKMVQLTDCEQLNEWSVHPSLDGKYVYYTTAQAGWRVDVETLEEEQLIDLSKLTLREPGMVASAMGTTALSRDGKWWAMRYTKQNMACLLVINTMNGQAETILERDDISHLQFCPDDDQWLFYAGPLVDRVWVIKRDGTQNRRLYKRDQEAKQWITHETWIPGNKELAFVDWPKGVKAVDLETGGTRQVVSFNAWHAICSLDGRWMIADTKNPDIGIQLYDPHDSGHVPMTVCYPKATNAGDHWNDSFPYDNGPIHVYAPQHTHPHPSFRPDNRAIVFTSDRTGTAQVYEADISAWTD